MAASQVVMVCSIRVFCLVFKYKSQETRMSKFVGSSLDRLAVEIGGPTFVVFQPSSLYIIFLCVVVVGESKCQYIYIVYL